MKAYIISLSKIPESINTAMKMIDPLKSYGFDVELFEGTYGTDAVKLAKTEGRFLHPIDQEGNKTLETVRTSGPGTLGCFYSHYRLWEKCIELNQPIWIFEDDVSFVRPYYAVDFDEVLITVLGSWKRIYERDVHIEPSKSPEAEAFYGPCVPGTPGYAIKPAAAKKLLTEFSKTYTASDSAIRSSVVKIQIHSHLMGYALTKEHGKISLTNNSTFWNDR